MEHKSINLQMAKTKTPEPAQLRQSAKNKPPNNSNIKIQFSMMPNNS